MQSPSQRITFVLTFPLPLLLVAFPCPKDKKTSGALRHTSTFLSPLSCASKSKRHGEIAQALVKQQHRLCFVQCLSSFSSFLARALQSPSSHSKSALTPLFLFPPAAVIPAGPVALLPEWVLDPIAAMALCQSQRMSVSPWQRELLLTSPAPPALHA